MRTILFAALCASTLSFGAARAAEGVIGTVETSGMVIEDTVDIVVFDDPTMKGISCYVTEPKRSLNFVDPTDSSLDCRRVGRVEGKPSTLKNVFEAAKGPWFKTMRVDRFYDADRNTLVYISYTGSRAGSP